MQAPTPNPVRSIADTRTRGSIGGRAWNTLPLAERIALRTNKGGPDECWPWTGSTTVGGYAQVNEAGRRVYVHRIVAGARDGQTVLHTCDNPPCLNPAHLRVGTQADNVADMVAKGRNRSGNRWATPVRSIAAYGTLRPGWGNYRYCAAPHLPTVTRGRLDGFVLLGEGRSFPYAVPCAGASLITDVLTFPAATWADALDACDGLEGYPAHYDRVLVPVSTDGGTVWAWVYTPAPAMHARQAPLRPVPGGDWSNSSTPRYEEYVR